MSLSIRICVLNKKFLSSLSSLSRRNFCSNDGIPTIDDLRKGKANSDEIEMNENPLNYTIFGKKKKDPFFYSNRKAGRGYANFSNTIYPNRPYIWPPTRLYIKVVVFTGTLLTFLAFLDYSWFYDRGNKLFAEFWPEAATIEDAICSEGEENIMKSLGNEEEKKKKKKKKVGFRERRIIEYENRIRLYSAPDKIFRYFSTLKLPNDDHTVRPYDIYMTPKDFVRSITPGVMQPRHLGLDKFKVYDSEKYKHDFVNSDSIFAKLGEHGLISFSDYLFLMTLLSTSPNDFRLAFKIFDLNGDGELDREEFERVQELVMTQTMVGQRHRERVILGLQNKQSLNSSLVYYFFGNDNSRKLSIDKFLQFQADLHTEILKIECERRDSESQGRISDVSFADLLLVHSGFSEAKQRKMLKRVKKKFSANSLDSAGISLEEISSFFRFLYQIENVDLALHFYNMAGASIDSIVLKTVARKIAGCDLSDHVIDVVITLFDDNQDGQLSHKEFVSVMKKRMKRGLERPRDTGLVKLIDAMTKCAVSEARDAIFAGF